MSDTVSMDEHIKLQIKFLATQEKYIALLDEHNRLLSGCNALIEQEIKALKIIDKATNNIKVWWPFVPVEKLFEIARALYD